MIVIVSKYFIPKGYRGLTIFPFVLLHSAEDKDDEILINHEQIHIRQQVEMLIFVFFIWYLIEFFLRYLQYKNWHRAYRNISFEREAYANETNLNFIKKRKFWNFLNYL